MLSFHFSDLGFELLDVLFGFFDLRDDSILTFVRLLELSFVLALLGLPLLLHFTFDLVFKLAELFLSILSDNLLSVDVFIFDCLELLIDFSRLTIVLLGQGCLQLLLCLFLFFIKAFSLFFDAFTDGFFGLALPVSDLCLLISLGLLLGILQLMIVA